MTVEVERSSVSSAHFVGQWDFPATQRGVDRRVQVSVRTDSGELGALDQGVEKCGDFGATQDARESSFKKFAGRIV
jgi:hypothetical protein